MPQTKKRGRPAKYGGDKRSKKSKADDSESDDDFSDSDDQVSNPLPDVAQVDGELDGNGAANGNKASNADNQQAEDGQSEVKAGTKREAIDAELAKNYNHTPGTLLVCGGTQWDLIGRRELPKAAKNVPPSPGPPNLWGPHKWAQETRVNYVVSHCTACHSVLITEDGRAMTWGRNDKVKTSTFVIMPDHCGRRFTGGSRP